jgi:hypothetical protein
LIDQIADPHQFGVRGSFDCSGGLKLRSSHAFAPSLTLFSSACARNGFNRTDLP